MDVRQLALASLRAHFQEVFETLETQSGRLFSHLAALPVPQHDAWRDVFFLELWSHAIDHNAHEAFHTLALYTPPELLEEAMALVVSAHEGNAVLPLMACLERRDGWNRHDRLRLIQCRTSSCSECRGIRDHVLHFLDLDADWALCRSKLLEARKRRLWTMWQPQIALNPATDVVFARIKSRTKRNWTRVMVAVVCVAMWKRWVERRLHPESSYVMGLLAARWTSMTVTTWTPAIGGWGGEMLET
jgi:hypothetical protein